MLGALFMKATAASSFKALNNRDIDAFLKDWHKDAVFIYPGTSSMSGEFHGIDAVRNWWEKFFARFHDVRFVCKGVYVKNIFAFGPSNEVALWWDVSVTTPDGNVFENTGTSIVKVKNGKVVSFQDFSFDAEKLNQAWF